MRRLSFIALLAAVFATHPPLAYAKTVTVSGRVVLTTGEPAANALIIVKDSWAGLFAMRERELTRLNTAQDGSFKFENVRYSHTLDIFVQGKSCHWWTGHGTVDPDAETATITIELLADSCTKATAGEP